MPRGKKPTAPTPVPAKSKKEELFVPASKPQEAKKAKRPTAEPLPPVPLLSPDFKYGRSKAIKMMCRQCNCGNRNAGKECEIRSCALWPYRGGLNDVTDEWKSYFHGWMKQRLGVNLVDQDQEKEETEEGNED